MAGGPPGHPALKAGVTIRSGCALPWTLPGCGATSAHVWFGLTGLVSGIDLTQCRPQSLTRCWNRRW